MTLDPRYLDTPERWNKLLALCMQQKEVGFDTEFQGGKIAVWSLAVYNGKRLTPHGFYPARGYVLPAAALETFAPLLTSSETIKWAHNAVSDTRSVYNHSGISLCKTYDTLSWIRVARPGIPKYGLKPLASLILGKPARPGFKEVTSYKREIYVDKPKKISDCECGTKGCRKRKGNHAKFKTTVTVRVYREEEAEYPIHDIQPGHERWSMFLDYALEDAVDALELASWLSRARDTLPVDTLDGPELSKTMSQFHRSRC